MFGEINLKSKFKNIAIPQKFILILDNVKNSIIFSFNFGFLHEFLAHFLFILFDLKIIRYYNPKKLFLNSTWKKNHTKSNFLSKSNSKQILLIIKQIYNNSEQMSIVQKVPPYKILKTIYKILTPLSAKLIQTNCNNLKRSTDFI